ncbi:MAG: protoheme IX farnesyltransferase [Bacteroidales bacterium]
MINKPVKLKDWLELTRLKIMIPVSLTGFTGYFAFDPHFSARLLFTSFGILLMAISASVLNQIQEVDIDKKMDRTRFRPLPSQRINLKNAILFSLVNLIAGILLIYFAGNIKAVLIGLITILWYNGIYTYSKRITAFAVVPGAITGALPPLIGWVAAGGGPWEKPIIFIGFLIFIGQIPHFWLLILKYGEEYKQAGLPSVTDIFNQTQIKRLTFSWVISSVLAALFLCYFEIIQTPVIIGILVIASSYILWHFFDLLRMQADKKPKNYSILLDSYFLLVILLLISDKIIS